MSDQTLRVTGNQRSAGVSTRVHTAMVVAEGLAIEGTMNEAADRVIVRGKTANATGVEQTVGVVMGDQEAWVDQSAGETGDNRKLKQQGLEARLSATSTSEEAPVDGTQQEQVHKRHDMHQEPGESSSADSAAEELDDEDTGSDWK